MPPTYCYSREKLRNLVVFNCVLTFCLACILAGGVYTNRALIAEHKALIVANTDSIHAVSGLTVELIAKTRKHQQRAFHSSADPILRDLIDQVETTAVDSTLNATQIQALHAHLTELSEIVETLADADCRRRHPLKKPDNSRLRTPPLPTTPPNKNQSFPSPLQEPTPATPEPSLLLPPAAPVPWETIPIPTIPDPPKLTVVAKTLLVFTPARSP
jgi:hypothetical protein